jgi:hypothetical protein
VPDKPSIVGYKVRFAPMVFFHPIRLGSGKSHCKKIASLLARFCEGPFPAYFVEKLGKVDGWTKNKTAAIQRSRSGWRFPATQNYCRSTFSTQ